ncbi:MAG: Veg family protein [Clostridiales bacterium]|nr:Veg family protein [Candidatus Scatonaster coprocaballi]
MIIKSDVEACKKNLESYIGRTVRLTSNGGRKRIIVHEGILDHCYPNMFTVKCDRKHTSSTQETVSYSYIDVLTKTVRIATVAETQAS